MKKLLSISLLVTVLFSDTIIKATEISDQLSLNNSIEQTINSVKDLSEAQKTDPKNSAIFKILQQKYPQIAQKILNSKELIEKNLNSSNDVVYFFTSASVPNIAYKNFILEASFLNYYFGTKVVIVLQGITNKEFENRMIKLREEFLKYDSSDIFLKNFRRVIDPKVFKDLNITKVPVIAFGKHKGDTYPSEADIKYLMRGDYPLHQLFKLILEKDLDYEEYYNTLIDTM